MKVLIADDEPSARSRLRRLLAGEAGLEIAGEAADGLAVVAMVESLRPDLVFLDIGMPGLNGLDALRALPAGQPLPLVIFVTGYDEYAMSAFREHALAYLLKPVDREDLALAVERARRLHAWADDGGRARHAVARLAGEVKLPLRQIVGRRQGRVLLLPVEGIRYFSIDQGIVKARTETESYSVSFQLAELESRLEGSPFFRARREALVNLAHVREIRPWFRRGLLLVMNDTPASEIVVSERQIPALRQVMPGL
ncbi:response regulator of the LytR/AlgR family [Opitutaceae bacterium TAV1]|nr:histidine kinase [Opitutaceae bacterium TAV5]EIP97074.1 response regulator of the LytR/AlgR family [Opitutaceae bacterium TAV1]